MTARAKRDNVKTVNRKNPYENLIKLLISWL